MDLHSHSIDVNGDSVSVTVYVPSSPTVSGTVVLCHGFCGIQTVLLPAFAAFFAENGLRAVTFDYRGFGSSGGERGRLLPAKQVDDINAVVRWVAAQDFRAGGTIALWGTSFGGSHVIQAAAENELIRCVVSQMPFADGDSLITGKMTPADRQSLIDTLDKMVERRQATGKEMMVPINKVLTDGESKAFFDLVRTTHPEIDVRIPFLTIRETLNYSPYKAAHKVKAPTLVIAAELDVVNPPEQAKQLFDALSCRKVWHVQPGARHYELYAAPHFEEVAHRQLDWLRGGLTAV